MTCSVEEVDLNEKSLIFDDAYYNCFYEPEACLAVLKKAGFNIDRISSRDENFGDLIYHCLQTISMSISRQEKIDTVNQALDDFVNGKYIKRFKDIAKKNDRGNDRGDDDDDDDDEEEEDEEDDDEEEEKDDAHTTEKKRKLEN